MSNDLKRRAVFLDRDGVINRNRADYCKSWSEFEFLDGTLSALARLAGTHFQVIVVSNQSAIGRGIVAEEDIEDIHRRMLEQITQAGGRVDAILYCPHRPDEGCACRKPRPGLLLYAAEEEHLDLTSSYMVGDSLDDIAAGRAAGCTPLLVRTGRGEAAIAELARQPDPGLVVVNSLASAVEWILNHESGDRCG